MKITQSLAFRIALIFSLIVSVILVGIIVTIQIRVRGDIGGFTTAENLQVTYARADEVGVLLDKIQWQARMIAERPEFRSLGADPAAAKLAIVGLDGRLSPEIVGCFVADRKGDYVSTLDKTGNIADRDYFAKVITEGADGFIGAPVISKSLGIPIVVVAVAVKDDAGSVVGLIGAQLALSDLSKITSKIRVGEHGYGWVLDQTGLVIADQNLENIMKLSVSEADKAGYRGLSALGARLVAEERGSGEFTTPDGQAVTSYFARIPQSPGWVLGVNLPTLEVDQTARQLAYLLVALLAIGVILTVIASVAIGRSIAKPLGQAALGFQELAGGDADLSVQLAVHSRDEVGMLVGDFNSFIAKLREMVGSLKTIQGELGAIGSGLGLSVQATHTAIQEMSVNIDRVREESRQQTESVAESSTAVEEIAKNIESLDQLIADQSASIIEASASIEEMVGNIASIGSSTDQMAGEFDSLSTAAADGKTTQSLAMQKINQIAERSTGLLEANKVIADIASQTNLLAMNAAIEAAHAGESGKGFAVVAQEIRRLAETAAEQSRTINRELSGVQSAITEVVESSKNSEAAFDNVAFRIEETDKLVRQVRQAMMEQEEGSSQILVALKAMNEVTSQVRLGSGEMRSGNQTILSEILRLKTSTRDINLTMETLVLGTESIKANSVQVQQIAGNTGDSIREMEDVIGRFKV